jgi:hypothetical protein
MMNLYGLGVTPDQEAAIGGFIATTPTPTSAQIVDFLKLYPAEARADVAQGLISAGADATSVTAAMRFLAVSGFSKSTIYGLLALASAGASGYHGVKRHHGSIGWGAWWFLMGGVFPIFTPIVAVAQGFGKAK